VAAGYVHKEISPERVATEVWRAAQSEPGFVDALASPVLFDCYKAVRTATTMNDAMDALNGAILKSGNSSVVVEFAKRAAPLAFGTSAPVHLSWRTNLFSQLTDYFVSRDAPGYVGPNGRFANVGELAAFKKTLRQHVATAVRGVATDPTTPKQWAEFVRATLKKVAG
jgi:hypothetical protein